MDFFSQSRARHFSKTDFSEKPKHKRKLPFKRVERKFKKIARQRLKAELKIDLNDYLQYA